METIKAKILRKPRVQKTCALCSKPFCVIIGSSADIKQIYCTRQCAGRAFLALCKRKPPIVSETTCPMCQKTFQHRACVVRKFCSHSCAMRQPRRLDKVKAAHAKMVKSRKTPFSRCSAKWMEIGGKRFFTKSGWERKYAAYLQAEKEAGRIKDWDYEPKTFWFKESIKWVRSYTPDFLVTFEDGFQEFHEVKGWMTQRAAEALRLMSKNYPEVTIKIIGTSWFKERGLLYVGPELDVVSN